MTKKNLAKNILLLVQNSIEDEHSDDEIIDDIEIYLDTLEPRNRETFCKWGEPHEQVEQNKCWA